MDIQKINEIAKLATDRMKNVHIGCFKGMTKPIFMISDQYPGVWMEHLYDSVMYARLFPGENEYMKNVIELFIDHQTASGQLPCYIWNKARFPEGTDVLGYGQIQEVVSFASICLKAYEILKDKAFLEKCYNSAMRWVAWLEQNRMTLNKGLIEMFYGYDTGHDNSGRLDGMSYHGNYAVDRVVQNAGILPPDAGAAPIIAVDMNCNFYGNLISLAEMALILDMNEDSLKWKAKAADVKKRLFDICLDRNDAFFYDVDKNGNKRKVMSCTVFHLFLEKVLDKNKDAELIKDIYARHLKNPDEFWTPYPFPSVANNDPSTKGHVDNNCWGYYCQMLIYLRCTLWMDDYGFGKDLDYICEKVLNSWTEHFNEIKLGQELDPITGVPTRSSEWYSSCMLFYVYAKRRVGV